MPAWFYILRLQSGPLYPGTTTNLKKRYGEHWARRACRTTKLDPPIGLVYSEEYETFSEALSILTARLKNSGTASSDPGCFGVGGGHRD
jgi:predicted GIY-YIG superfamily endonuclease